MVWFLDGQTFERVRVMVQYADAPMDLVDASLVVATESLDLRKLFTVDGHDFSTYRITV